MMMTFGLFLEYVHSAKNTEKKSHFTILRMMRDKAQRM